MPLLPGLVIACLTATARPAIPLTIVGTNDVHGWIFPIKNSHPSGVEFEEGGFSVFAGYVDILRRENPDGVLLLDAGDMFQGTLVSNAAEGAPVVTAYNALGYTAAAVGNHEFDYGPQGPVSVAQPGMDPFGALKARILQAKFPLLSRNLYEKESRKRPAWLPGDGTLLVQRNGIKVGIIGLTTPQTPYTTQPQNVATLQFAPLAQEAAAAAQELRNKGAEVVVLTAHVGGRCGDLQNPRDATSCDRNEELLELLHELPEGTLDAVVAGHTHHSMGHFIHRTPVIESRAMGKYFGVIDLFLDSASHKVLPALTHITSMVPICERMDQELRTCEPAKLQPRRSLHLVQAVFRGKPVARDPAIEQVLAPFREGARAEHERPLGLFVPKRLTRTHEAESPLGSLLTDALKEATSADVALMNSGGLRADLPAGEARYGDIYAVMPFDNTVATLSLTGEELHRLLQAAYGGKKGVFQQAGLKVLLRPCPGKERLRGVTLADGTPLSGQKRYRVVLPDFLARGGDGLAEVMKTFPSDRVSYDPTPLREVLLGQWVKNGKPLVSPAPGRIAFEGDPAACQ